MANQIKDLYNIVDSEPTLDYFIFQRIDGNNNTYRISQENLLKTCIQWGDNNIITSLEWSKVIYKPIIHLFVTGKAIGQASIDMNLEQYSFNLNITDLDLSNVALKYTPVQQGGGIGQSSTDTLMLGWNSNTSRLKATLNTSTDLGNVVFDSNLVWSSILEKPILTFSFTGNIIGDGFIDLNFNNGGTFNITQLNIGNINWSDIVKKPTFNFNINGLGSVNVVLSQVVNSATIPITFDLSKINLNALDLGSRSNQNVYFSITCSDYTNASDHDLIMYREAGRLGRFIINNTLYCNQYYYPTDNSWNTWNPLLNTSWVNDFSFQNRIEMSPLLSVPNLIVQQCYGSSVVVEKLYLNGTNIKLVINGVEINLANLIALTTIPPSPTPTGTPTPTPFATQTPTPSPSVDNSIPDNKGYFIGGVVLGYPTTNIDRFNFSNETIKDISSALLLAKFECVGVYSSLSGYVAGGRLLGSVSSSIEKLNFLDEVMSLLSAVLEFSTYNLAGTQSVTKGYYGGGLLASTAVVNTITSLVFSSESRVNLVNSLGIELSNMAGINTINNGYWCGGNDTTITRNIITTLDFTNETIANDSNLLSDKRTNITSVHSSSKGYLVGGRTDNVSTPNSIIDKFIFANESITTQFTSIINGVSEAAGIHSSITGYIGGGIDVGFNNIQSIISINYTNDSIDLLSAIISNPNNHLTSVSDY